MTQSDTTHRLRTMLEQVGAVEATNSVRTTLESRASGRTRGPALEMRTTNPESAYARAGLEALDVLHRGGKLDTDKRFALEAIVMPLYRPVVDVVDDYIVVDQLQETWKDLGDESRRGWTRDRIRAVGRINVPGIMYAGTAFVVGPNLLMTNRHVASFFTQGLGTRIDFQPGLTASVGFYHEKGVTKSESLKVEKVVMIHPWWDMAILLVTGLSGDRKPLTLSTIDPARLVDRKVVVIGYPGYDPSDDQEFQRVQERIFRGTYYVKRFQPGVFRVRDNVESYGRIVSAVTHDCSTLGGNSGSAVIDIETGDVLGLHFAGTYLSANYAVSPFDLAQDNRVISALASAGVMFEGRLDPSGDFYGPIKAAWDDVERSGAAIASAREAGPNTQSLRNFPVPQFSNSSAVPVPSNSATFSIPLHLSVSIGSPVLSVNGITSPTGLSMAEPTREGQFSGSPPAATISQFHLPSLTSQSFTWKAALSLALASKLAYESEGALTRTAREDWKFDSCEFIDVDDTQCFVAMNRDLALVSFRGTESRGDWFRNVNVPGRTREYGVVHRGFLGAFQAVETRLRLALSQLNGRKLLLTGHSLGGALATVMAAEWQRMMPATWVATFGQPAVCGASSRMFFLLHYSGRFFRFVNDNDIVPRVPPGYEHVGRFLHFDSAGNLRHGQSLPANEGVIIESALAETFDQGPPMLTEAEYNQMLARMAESTTPAHRQESVLAPREEALFTSVSDHSIDKYISKIVIRTGV